MARGQQTETASPRDLICMLSIVVVSETSVLDRLRGYYSAPERLRIEFEGGKYLPWHLPVRDCLHIA